MAVPLPAPDGTPRDITPPTTATARRSRPALLVGAVLAGFAFLTITGLGLGYGLVSAQFAPSASVSRFLDLVVKGKPIEAEKQLSPQPLGLDTLIQDKAYDALPDRVTAYQILSSSTSGTRATVTVRVRTAAGSWNERFSLVTHRTRLGLWNAWTIDGGGFSTIRLGPNAPGMGLALDDSAGAGDVPDEHGYVVLPGTYHLTSTTGSPLLATQSMTVKVTSFTRVYHAGVTARLNDAGQAKAHAAIDAFVDGCVAQKVLAPGGGCGYSVDNDSGYAIQAIHWALQKRPEVSIGGAYHDGYWDVQTVTRGVLVVDALVTDGSRYGVLETSVDDKVQGYLVPDGADGLRFVSDFDDEGSGGDSSSGSVA